MSGIKIGGCRDGKSLGKLIAIFLVERVGVRACNFFADPQKTDTCNPFFAWDMQKLVALTHGLKQDTSTRVDQYDSCVDFFISEEA